MKSHKMSFVQKLQNHWEKNKFICVGLDPDIQKIPISIKKATIQATFFKFNKAIIDATVDLVCAFKPNPAFYEPYGKEGIDALFKTIAYIHEKHPDMPVILDAKRGDIGNTNNGYAKAAFDYLRADAITVQSYLGKEAVQPFLDWKDKGILILVKTSNPGAGEFQDLKIIEKKKTMPLYKYVAHHVAKEWNAYGNCGVVVGATYPKELKEVRQIVGDMPILIPGVGSQGGDIAQTIKAGKNSKGHGMIINISRGILYASAEKNFAKIAREELEKLYNI